MQRFDILVNEIALNNSKPGAEHKCKSIIIDIGSESLSVSIY